MDLPKFTYHPDPLATGSIRAGVETCPCCGQARGYVYDLNPYCEEDVINICPWCIADGSAARKFDAEFVDPSPLVAAGLSEEIIDEVTHRTPGFETWQPEIWMACCNDACEFHGEMTKREIEEVGAEAIDRLMRTYELSPDDMGRLLSDYAPGGEAAIYKFVCRHCGIVHLALDFA